MADNISLIYQFDPGLGILSIAPSQYIFSHEFDTGNDTILVLLHVPKQSGCTMIKVVGT